VVGSPVCLCNDGERHAVALELRKVRGCGPYVYARYKAAGKVRRDYIGKIKILLSGGRRMAKLTMECPTPGCGETLTVDKTKTGKVKVFCDRCRFQGFVRSRWGNAAWFDEAPPAATPAPPPPSEPKEPVAPRPSAAPPSPSPAAAAAKERAAEGSRKDIWDLE
jgi:hypothetical protein